MWGTNVKEKEIFCWNSSNVCAVWKKPDRIILKVKKKSLKKIRPLLQTKQEKLDNSMSTQTN